jgi:hypothetical protein
MTTLASEVHQNFICNKCFIKVYHKQYMELYYLIKHWALEFM